MTDAVPGRSLELYFIDGKPDGMLTAEVFNWTGHTLVIPRTQLAKGLARIEAKRTGVYLLFGEQDGDPIAYIGEAEEIGRRLKEHAAKKDWWTNAVLVTTSGDSLHKAHVKYLESRLVEIATEVGSISLENGNQPPRAGLSDAHQANMEVFLDNLLLVLPALRIDMFLNKKRSAPVTGEPEHQPNTPRFELKLTNVGVKATAELDGSDFVVLKGSQARGEWIQDPKHKASAARLYQELCEQGILIAENGFRKFVEDYAFNSPSAAASIVSGRSAAGPIAWKVSGSDKTYKDWEAEQISMDE